MSTIVASATVSPTPATVVNPFLDPYSIPQGSRPADPGQPLNRLQIPPIQTLISKTAENSAQMAFVNVTEVLTRAGITPRENILVRDESIGIELNLNLFGSVPVQTPANVTPADLQTRQGVGRRIPTTVEETRAVLHLITPQRTGSRNEAYNINELRQIVKNLQLPPAGNKDVLVNRIRSHIIEYYNLPSGSI